MRRSGGESWRGSAKTFRSSWAITMSRARSSTKRASSSGLRRRRFRRALPGFDRRRDRLTEALGRIARRRVHHAIADVEIERRRFVLLVLLEKRALFVARAEIVVAGARVERERFGLVGL